METLFLRRPVEAKFKELLPALPEKIFSEDESDSDKKDKIWKTGY